MRTWLRDRGLLVANPALFGQRGSPESTPVAEPHVDTGA
jgi:hypothetical protein